MPEIQTDNTPPTDTQELAPSEVQDSATNLEDLSAKEIETVFAMLTTSRDVDAIALSPYEERMFYKLKPKLSKYVSALAARQAERAQTALQGAAFEAVGTLRHLMTSARGESVKLDAAKTVLDRALGAAGKEGGIVNNSGGQMIVQITTKGKE
jgi:hypothetical protein